MLIRYYTSYKYNKSEFNPATANIVIIKLKSIKSQNTQLQKEAMQTTHSNNGFLISDGNFSKVGTKKLNIIPSPLIE
jgi:hypothetical protein